MNEVLFFKSWSFLMYCLLLPHLYEDMSFITSAWVETQHLCTYISMFKQLALRFLRGNLCLSRWSIHCKRIFDGKQTIIRPVEMESSFLDLLHFFAYGENKNLLQLRRFSLPKYLIIEHAWCHVGRSSAVEIWSAFFRVSYLEFPCGPAGRTFSTRSICWALFVQLYTDLWNILCLHVCTYFSFTLSKGCILFLLGISFKCCCFCSWTYWLKSLIFFPFLCYY